MATGDNSAQLFQTNILAEEVHKDDNVYSNWFKRASLLTRLSPAVLTPYVLHVIQITTGMAGLTSRTERVVYHKSQYQKKQHFFIYVNIRVMKHPTKKNL